MAKSDIVVESAVELSKEHAKDVTSLLESKFGKQQIQWRVNPTILGGLRITVGSTRYDASVQGKLDTLKAQS